MKKDKIFKKKNISLMYAYLCLKEEDSVKKYYLYTGSDQWFEDFKVKREFIYKEINSCLKNGWNVDMISLIEKALLSVVFYDLIYSVEERRKAIILLNQAISFSEKYLETNNFKYINAVLDSVIKKRSNFQQ